MLRINPDKLKASTSLDTLNPVELLIICKILASELHGRSKADKINIKKLQNIFEAVEIEK